MTRKLTTTDGIISVLRDLNVQVVQSELDDGVKGVVSKLQDGYIVILDPSLCFDCMLETLKHELCHIILGHLDDDVKTEDEKEKEVIHIMEETEK